MLLAELDILRVDKHSWMWNFGSLKALKRYVKVTGITMTITGCETGCQDIIRELESEGIDASVSACGEGVVVPASDFYPTIEAPDKNEIERHAAEVVRAYRLFEDDQSRRIYSACVGYALDRDDSRFVISQFRQYLHPEVKPEEGDVVLDGGAFIGDTVNLFLEATGDQCFIYAFEPDGVNFEELKESFGGMRNVFLFRKGLWESGGRMSVARNEGEGNSMLSVLEDSPGEVEVVTVDSIFGGRSRCDLIKLNVEGSELHVLRGAVETIVKWKPKLQVAVYHRKNHLWEIPLFISSLCAGYRFYLGHHLRRWGGIVFYCV